MADLLFTSSNRAGVNVPDPQVSIVLPVYNAAAAVIRAVASVQRQTVAAWELLLIDDGSTDGTLPAIQRLAQTDSRIRVIACPRAGIVPALNAGLSAARAPLIARMDADDEMHPDRLAEQVRLLRDRPNIGLAGCLVQFGGDPIRAAGYALHVDWINQLVEPGAIALQRFVESPFAHPSVMFRRALVERYGGYRDGDFPEDYELWLRWLEACVEMAKAPKVLLTWNDSPGRLSRSDGRYGSEAFYRCKTPYLVRWLQGQVEADRQLLVWGAGRPTRKRAELLSTYGMRIGGYIDIDPAKIGRVLSGRRVLGPGEIPSPATCFVLGYVGKRGARDLARAQLQSRGFVEGKDFLMAA